MTDNTDQIAPHDRAARACYEGRFQGELARVPEWDKLPEYAKDRWRSAVAAALKVSPASTHGSRLNEAALQTAMEYSTSVMADIDTAEMREAIRIYSDAAATPAPESRLRVKPLEWTECTSPKGSFIAVSVAGDYVIRERSGDVRLSLPETSGWTRYPRHVEAKAAAQASYERRLMSAFAAPPQQNLMGPNFGSHGSATAMFDVIAERLRQQEKEGWTPEHDDAHKDGELAQAAAVYAHPFKIILAERRDEYERGNNAWPWYESVDVSGGRGDRPCWGWRPAWLKKTDRRRDLVKAAALIIAEIERLDRTALATTEGSDNG